MVKIIILKKYNFLIAIIAFGIISLIPGFSRFQDLSRKESELKFKTNQLIAENKELSDRQHKLLSDPIYAESVARQKLNVAKEGEVVYKIIPKEE